MAARRALVSLPSRWVNRSSMACWSAPERVVPSTSTSVNRAAWASAGRPVRAPGQGGGVLRIQLAQGGQQLDLVLGGQGDAVDGHRGEEGLQHPLRQGEEEGLLLAGVCGPRQAGQGLLEGLLLGGGEVRGGQDGPRLLGELGLVPQAGGDGLGHGL